MRNLWFNVSLDAGSRIAELSIGGAREGASAEAEIRPIDEEVQTAVSSAWVVVMALLRSGSMLFRRLSSILALS